MRIWVKMKFDPTMNMDIPHSPNIATAMYGFREFGVEMIPYHEIKDIYDKVSNEDIVLDYIDQCQTIFSKFGITPSLPNYPKEMEDFLGRKIWTDTINSISSNESKWSAGYFVKPIKQKAFTGKIISSISDLVGTGSSTEDLEVLCSEPIQIMAEWRGFILYDRLLDLRPYGLFFDKKDSSWKYHYDEKTVESMMNAFTSWENRPSSCSMDICVTKDNKTLLVEFNDAYALGSYGLPSIFYAKMIGARWAELFNRKDEFNF